MYSTVPLLSEWKEASILAFKRLCVVHCEFSGTHETLPFDQVIFSLPEVISPPLELPML